MAALIFAMSVSCSNQNPAAGPVPDQRWNFLIVVVDDLGQMDIQPNNPQSFYQTPNLLVLASQSLRFDHNYAASPICSPSRYALLTGNSPARAAITDWVRSAGNKHRTGRFNPAKMNEFMELAEVSLAEALRSAGYATAFVGKWHLGEHEMYWPESQGFDINIGGYSSGSPRGENGYFAPYNNPRLIDGPDGEYLTERLTSDAISLLKTYADARSPFLLYLSYYTVHRPLGAPQETVRSYEDKVAHKGHTTRYGNEEQVWPEADGPRRVRHSQDHPIYAAMVEQMDLNIGRLLSALDALGIAENTLVVFTSDNGGLSTSEGLPTSNLPYRGGKGWMYEGGIRVPLIVRWPGRTKPGTVNSTPVVAMDLFPTVLEIAGLDQGSADGQSLVPIMTGRPDSADRPIFWHYPHYSNQGGIPASAVRLGKYKLIRRLEDGRTHLFDLIADPGEHEDLSVSLPTKRQELAALLDDWYQQVDARFLEPASDGSPWRPATNN